MLSAFVQPCKNTLAQLRQLMSTEFAESGPGRTSACFLENTNVICFLIVSQRPSEKFGRDGRKNGHDWHYTWARRARQEVFSAGSKTWAQESSQRSRSTNYLLPSNGTRPRRNMIHIHRPQLHRQKFKQKQG